MTTPIFLPPLPEPEYATWQYNQHGMAVLEKTEAYTADQLRTRDLEIVRIVLEGVAQAAQPDDSYQDRWFHAKADAVKRIRALEIKHHE
jgi:hypothetical protein